jgi:phospho-N-acetylmuramoyl-pentapeptide-transferase
VEAQVLTLGLGLALFFLPLSAWASPRLARWINARQHIRPEGPSTHKKKAGTPTMGGLVPLSLVLLGTGIVWLWIGPDHASVFAVVSMILGSLVGFVDDLRSQQSRRSVGFFPHQTIAAQFLASLLLLFLAKPLPKNTFALFQAQSSPPYLGMDSPFGFGIFGHSKRDEPR